jgi:regulatory protein
MAGVSRPEEDDVTAARRLAVSLLARRDYCSGELRSRLEKKGFATDVIDPLIADLQRRRALDDERYVERFVAYRAGRGQGPIRILAELRPLGLPVDVIERHLQAFGDWRSRAQAVRMKKFGAAVPTDFAARARQARFLEYRGFDADQVRAALDGD